MAPAEEEEEDAVVVDEVVGRVVVVVVVEVPFPSCDESRSSLNPSWHWYFAAEPNVLPSTSRVPLARGGSGGQRT